MFGTILLETALYVTKSYKSDLITQKAQRMKKDSEKKRFEDYYHKQKAAEQQNATETTSNTTRTTKQSGTGEAKTRDGEVSDSVRDRGRDKS